MHHQCSSCEIDFESEAKRPRCPVCMRMTTVSRAEARRGAGWKRGALIVTLVVVALGVIVGVVVLAWPSGDGAGGAGAAEDDEAAARGMSLLEGPRMSGASLSMSLEEFTGLHELRAGSGAAEEARRILGQREGVAALQALSRYVTAQLGARQLRVIEAGARLPRGPLAWSLLARGSVAALGEGQHALLYPDELTMLLWAVAAEAGLEVDLVWLEPETPRVGRWPAAALRMETDDGPLALDPRTGALRAAGHLTRHGPELLWSSLALLEGRYALERRALEQADGALAQAERLTPGLWGVQALQVERARVGGALEAAQAAVEGLAARADHPAAWRVEALVMASGADGRPDPGKLAARYAEIVESFPHEARLAVELGDLLSEQGRHQEAGDAYELALSRDPAVSGAHTGLALLLALADPQAALEHAHEELALHAGYPPAYLAMAFVHALQGAIEDAAQVAERGRLMASDAAAYDARYEALIERAARVRSER